MFWVLDNVEKGDGVEGSGKSWKFLEKFVPLSCSRWLPQLYLEEISKHQKGFGSWGVKWRRCGKQTPWAPSGQSLPGLLRELLLFAPAAPETPQRTKKILQGFLFHQEMSLSTGVNNSFKIKIQVDKMQIHKPHKKKISMFQINSNSQNSNPQNQITIKSKFIPRSPAFNSWVCKKRENSVVWF